MGTAERRRIHQLTSTQILSVAELSAHLSLPLGVVRVLVGDLADEALVVPVVHDAGSRRLRALATDIAEIAERARRHQLRLDDLEGATFTITNVGSYGTVVSAPIINQPQVAILSTDGVRHEPVANVTEDGSWSVTVHPVGNLSLSFDHRAVDGAYAARFLARVREVLETLDWSAEAGT
jgi:2-oxoglutarate dehydrogenase E2 component (dihydrolipoamide succinyltransferase)